MAEFYEEKIEECKKVFAGYFTTVTISPPVLDDVGRGFSRAFRSALTDEGDPDFGKAAWKLTEEPLKANVRKLAALTEFFAREANTAEVTVDHVKQALAEVKCPVETASLRKRRLDYCGFLL